MPKSLHPDLTHSVEDYLKAIYALSEDGSPASTTRIAELLDLSAPSVSGMVKRLAEKVHAEGNAPVLAAALFSNRQSVIVGRAFSL